VGKREAAVNSNVPVVKGGSLGGKNKVKVHRNLLQSRSGPMKPGEEKPKSIPNFALTTMVSFTGDRAGGEYMDVRGPRLALRGGTRAPSRNAQKHNAKQLDQAERHD